MRRDLFTVWAEEIRLFKKYESYPSSKVDCLNLDFHVIMLTVFAAFNACTVFSIPSLFPLKKAKSKVRFFLIFLVFLNSGLPLEEILELTVFSKCFLAFSHNWIDTLKDLKWMIPFKNGKASYRWYLLFGVSVFVFLLFVGVFFLDWKKVKLLKNVAFKYLAIVHRIESA